MKLQFKLIIVLFLATLSKSECCSSQELFAVSNNNQFVAYLHYEGESEHLITYAEQGKRKQKKEKLHTNRIDVYSIKYLSKIACFRLRSKNKETPDTIGFSPNGLSVFASQGKTITVWNLLTKQIIKEFSSATDIAFAHTEHFFVVFSKGQLTSYLSNNGKFWKKYRISKRTEITKLQITDDDKYIVVTTKRDIQIWDKNHNKLLKRCLGNNVRFSDDLNNIIYTRKTGKHLNAYVYSFPGFKKINRIGTSTILRDITREMKNSAREKRKGKSIRFKKVEYISDESSINPNGHILAISILNKNIPDLESLLLVDTYTSSVLIALQNDNIKTSIIPYKWMDDKYIIVNYEANPTKIFNIEEKRFTNFLNFQLELNKEDKYVSLNYQQKNRLISPDNHYFAVPYSSRKTSGIYVQPTLIKQLRSHAADAFLLAFSPNSKYIFVKNKENRIGFIQSSDVESDLGKSNLPVRYFNDSLMVNIKEDVTDEKIPEGYHYQRINNLKHISEAQSNDLVKLYLKTMEFSDSLVGLQVHLIDKNGNYFYGGGTEAWKHIWCNLLIREMGGLVKQIPDFEVMEYYEEDSIPNAIAIIMDHSGSMGNNRAYNLQNGAELFIRKKREKDAIAIIKYDNKIGIESFLSNNKNLLVQQLRKEGITGYGGSTSLLDAINEGISLLQNEEIYKKKTIIILTDGNENSSLANKNEVLVRSIKNDINIFTIGFGDIVSEEYLKSIAYNTQGSYYKIYDSRQLEWIFDDIYTRIRNYYSIRFKTQQTGKHFTVLEICIEFLKQDSLMVNFDNTPINLLMAQESEEDVFEIPFSQTDITNSNTNDYHIPVLKDFDQIKIGLEREFSYDTTKNLAALQEFNKIQFPDIRFVFDKTVIIKGTDKGLNQLASFMKKYPELRILISGHTDNYGSNAYNLNLSLNRAKKAKELLVKMGIESGRISVKGFGELKPVDSNNTDKGRKMNRRVEFSLI